MPRILALRFSALGDVAMSVPVLASLAESNPDSDITVVSREKWGALFAGMPPNVSFYGVDFADYPGPRGMERLYRELRAMGFDCVADLHGVLRTRYLGLRFRMAGTPVAVIDKGRREKRLLVSRGGGGKATPLTPTPERYAAVLRRLGLKLSMRFSSVFGEERGDMGTLAAVVGAKNEDEWVGVAPFAQHEGKVYPQRLMERVVALLCKRPRRRVLVFGGGDDESRLAREWQSRYPAVTSLVGRGRLADELGVMSRLDVMLSMDSANMHLAAIAGTKVLSIWGATHPATGFAAWGQTPDSFIQADMECRPCSVYGSGKCRRGDRACLNRISPDLVAERVETALKAAKLAGKRI